MWRSDSVSPDGYERHLEALEGFVYIGTWTYGGTTSVVVEVHQSEPTLTEADHVVEVTLDGDGPLAILNWSESDGVAAEVDLPPGRMALRSSWTGLESLKEFPELEVASDWLSPEMIRLQIWPSTDSRSRVLTSWRGV